MCPLCWCTPRWWGVEKTTYNRWWFPSLGSTVCRCWYFSNLLVDQVVVLLPCEGCCQKLDTIVDFVGNFLFPVVVGTIQPFEVGSTKPCCLHVFVESEVLTCCCYLNSCWWCCHSVGCHSSCCWSKRRWRPNTVETKRLRLDTQLLSAFSCWHSQRRSLLLFNKMLNWWNKNQSKTCWIPCWKSCCLRHHVARHYEDLDCWPNMLKFTVSSTKKKRMLLKYSVLKCLMAQRAPLLYVRCAQGAFTVC